jgi:hypothetical protein
MSNRRDFFRVLGIAPYSRGFGFAVVENGHRLIDYGLVQIRPCTRARVSAKLTAVLVSSQPSLVALPEITPERGGRSAWATSEAVRLACSFRVRWRQLDGRSAFFGLTGGGAGLEQAIVSLFPELEPRRPRRRRVWESEDERKHMFLAVALALAASPR